MPMDHLDHLLGTEPLVAAEPHIGDPPHGAIELLRQLEIGDHRTVRLIIEHLQFDLMARFGNPTVEGGVIAHAIHHYRYADIEAAVVDPRLIAQRASLAAEIDVIEFHDRESPQ